MVKCYYDPPPPPSKCFKNMCDKNDDMDTKIEEQVEFIKSELARTKFAINSTKFNCTTAPYVLVKQYRDSLKIQLNLLLCNLYVDD
jgi:hypothetical protein